MSLVKGRIPAKNALVAGYELKGQIAGIVEGTQPLQQTTRRAC